jgi:4-hydroxy-2-oxoheptanedioate aldolase
MLDNKRELFLRFKQQLSEKKTAFGLITQSPDTAWAEIIALTGFDFAWIDMEHTARTFGEVQHLIVALENYGCIPFVRVRQNEPNCIGQVLDMGARVAIVPHVDTVDDALRAVHGAKYYPLGRRGYATCSRSTRHGIQKLNIDSMQEKNDETMLMVLIESEQAVRNVEDIAAVDGIDILFVGYADLTQDMGLSPDTNHPRLTEAVEKVGKALNHSGKIGAFSVSDPSRVPYYRDLGFYIICCGMDTMLLKNAAETTFARFKAGENT